MGIVDSNGTEVVKYSYDVWGLPMFATEGSMASTLGKANPFRYRGYVYDEETGLYYLRSRYYNPEWGRFLNADVVLGTDDLVSHNVYVYCRNNPIDQIDESGLWGDWIGALATVAVAVVVAAAVIAAAPVIAGAVGTTAICLGAASLATTASTVANVACATVAVTTLACGVNRGVEAVTGENYGAKLMGEEGYERFEIATTMASTAISMAPSYLPYPSTGRTIPNNLKEQMKYRYAIQDKTRGKVIIPYLKDSRMPGWMGWQKYSIYGDGVDIHYVGHRFLPVRFDYKIK